MNAPALPFFVSAPVKRADGDDGRQFKKKLMTNTITKQEASTGSERPSSDQKTTQHDFHVIALSAEQNRLCEEMVWAYFDANEWCNDTHICDLLDKTHNVMTWAQTYSNTIQHTLQTLFREKELNNYMKACIATSAARWQSNREWHCQNKL